MKKFSFFIVIIFILTACVSSPIDKDWTTNYHIKNSFKTLKDVNTYVNSYPYRDDSDNYGISDYWATPEEFFSNQSGDCEDYAVAKYYLMKRDNLIPKGASVQFIHVYVPDRNEGHMVLRVGDTIYDNVYKTPIKFDSTVFELSYDFIRAYEVEEYFQIIGKAL
jgi:predicted transglutaminase-like cysteine proteinase